MFHSTGGRRMSLKMRSGVWVLAALTIGLAACHRAVESSHSDGAPVEQSYTVGATLGTAAPAAEVRFMLPAAPVVGRGFRVDAVMVFARPTPDVRVEVVGDDGLTIVSPPTPAHLQRLESGARVPLGIEASAETAGTHLVTVRVTSELSSADVADAVVFPVVVGAAPVAN